MPIIYSILAAIIPMSFYLILVYKLDKYEKEPIFFILFHFLWGAFVAVGIVFIIEGMLRIFINEQSFFNSHFIGLLIKAPFIEELAKISLIIYTSRSMNLDNLTDGLVYGAAIGLGFGMTENALYFISNSESVIGWIYLVIIRSSFSGVMHGISSSIFAAFIMLSKFHKVSLRKLYYFFGFSIAFIIHFTWNFSVINEETFIYGVLSILICVSTFVIIIKSSLRYEIKILNEQLIEENFQLNDLERFYKKRKSFINLPLQQFQLYIKLGFAKKKILFATAKETEKLDNYINDLRNKIALQQS